MNKFFESIRNILNKPKLILLWIFLFGFPLLLAYYIYISQSWLPEYILTIENVHSLNSNSTFPPRNNIDEWRLVTLPDDWKQTHTESKNVWYQFTLDLNVPPNRLWAIYLPTISMNAAVYLNEQLLGEGGSFDEPMARNWNRPQYFIIPNGMLKPGENIFQIRIASPTVNQGYIDEIHLAPNEVLRPAYEFRCLIEVTVAQIITGSLLIMGLFMAALCILRKGDPVYGWFTLCLFVWALHNLNLFVVDIPVSTRLWEWLWFITMVWFVITVTIFVHRFTGIKRPKFEKNIVLISTVGSIILLVLPENWFYKLGFGVWDTFAVVLGVYPSYMLAMTYRKTRDLSTYMLLLSGLPILILGAHDWLMLNQFVSRADGLMLHFAAPLPLMIFSWILLTRFVRVLDEAESLNVDLERRVELKRIELEKNFQKLQELEKKSVLVHERERIMRDMHDGMGGHLVSTLSMIEASEGEHEDISQSLRDALDDLRVMIDSLDPVDDDLTTVLGMYRSRIQPRLEQSDIKVNWKVTDIPNIPDLGPEKVLQVLRILQEAISNIIKHAEASQITVETEEVNSKGNHCVYVRISDDGKGMEANNSNGRGLNNMRRRAEQIGAELDIKSQALGTQISLRLSL